ncbi:MAG: nucleotide exchange factor GrpE [Anaerolineae bacterium]|nr:nucleotide exchange factor GrpE [Anaerolineae bacterium]
MAEETKQEEQVTEEKVKTGEQTVQETMAPSEQLPDDPAELKKLLLQERDKSAEYLDNWRRAAADFSNYRKRIEKDNAEFTKFANTTLITRLLPILDDFERAFQTVPDNLRALTWVDGIFLIARKMAAILEAEGLKPIEALNQPFDPRLHEAVIHEETDQHEDGIVIAELQKGYRLNDRVIRPTLVKVAKKKA